MNVNYPRLQERVEKLEAFLVGIADYYQSYDPQLEVTTSYVDEEIQRFTSDLLSPLFFQMTG